MAKEIKMKVNLYIMKGFTVGIIFLFIGSCIIPTTAQNIEKSSQLTSRGNWLYVGGSGSENYTKIQDAIDTASEGDTVFVYSGSYNENIVINKSIVVTGQDRDTTIIMGGNNSEIIEIKESSVEFKGFTIQKYNETNIIGIMIRGCWSCHISQNTVKSCYYGILVTESESLIVSNNTILDCSYGIVNVIIGNITITENTIDGNGEGSGIELQVTIFKNYITRNSITNNSLGINLIFTLSTVVQENNFLQNQQQAFFTSSFLSVWRQNYWNQSHILPKVIPGQFGGMLLHRKIPLINFDWRPAQEPFVISGMS
jgi:parallel beta-helix repeat protein